MKIKIRERRQFSTTRMIILGFLIAVAVGTVLLCLPVASATGTATPFVDALFTATTSICVTGLVTVPTFENWSLFGQIVILFLIQFGGLGIITFTTTVLLFFGRRITLKDRMLIQESYNLDTLRGLVKLTRKIVKGTLLIEGIGAVLYSFVLVPEFGFVSGVWKSVFNAVSAFCNAGMDIIGPDSLCAYRDNPLMNFTTCALIILGGIGFPVWWDVLRVIRLRMEEKFDLRTLWRKLQLHTKLAVTASLALIFGGALLTLALEYNNPLTLGELSFFHKIQAALFQSVTLRTAGFLTIPQQNFTADSTFLFLLLMFIGGSPSGTAGGVKTVTVVVLMLAIISIVKGKNDVEAFGRSIPDSYVKKALAVAGIGAAAVCTIVMIMCLVEPAGFVDIIYEVVSATGTVGLTRGITPSLSLAGKLIIICAMFLGRIG